MRVAFADLKRCPRQPIGVEITHEVLPAHWRNWAQKGRNVPAESFAESTQNVLVGSAEVHFSTH